MNVDNFNIELSLNELNIVLAYLGKQPYESVYTVIEKIQKQAQAQSTNSPMEK